MKRNRRISLSDNTLELIQKAHPETRNPVALEEIVQHYFRLQNQVGLYQKTLDDEAQRRRKLQAMCDKRDRIIAWIIASMVAIGSAALFMILV